MTNQDPSQPTQANHNPDPNYLRQLLAQAGLSQTAAAKRIGVSARTFRDYLNPKHQSQAPYTVQYALESIINNKTLDIPHHLAHEHIVTRWRNQQSNRHHLGRPWRETCGIQNYTAVTNELRQMQAYDTGTKTDVDQAIWNIIELSARLAEEMLNLIMPNPDSPWIKTAEQHPPTDKHVFCLLRRNTIPEMVLDPLQGWREEEYERQLICWKALDFPEQDFLRLPEYLRGHHATAQRGLIPDTDTSQ